MLERDSQTALEQSPNYKESEVYRKLYTIFRIFLTQDFGQLQTLYASET